MIKVKRVLLKAPVNQLKDEIVTDISSIDLTLFRAPPCSEPIKFYCQSNLTVFSMCQIRKILIA